MSEDAYCLCLLDAELAGWIRRSDGEQLQGFALACAEVAIGLVQERGDVGAQLQAAELAALLTTVRQADDDGETRRIIERRLMTLEESLALELSLLRTVRVPARRFELLAGQWYAVRALRGALARDRVAGAGRAAFAAISATHDEARIRRLTERG